MTNQIIAPPHRAARTKRTTSKAEIPSNVIPFRRPAAKPADAVLRPLTMHSTLVDALVVEQRGHLQGLIQIVATEEGEQITIMGAFADRMEFGQFALIKALNIMTDKIAEGGDAGYSTSPPIKMRSIEEVPHA